MTGSPAVTAKPLAGTATLSEKALAVIRWQPRQWQTMVRISGSVIRNRTCPHRHPPSIGLVSLMEHPPAPPALSKRPADARGNVRKPSSLSASVRVRPRAI
jgi:hypothetical protein